MLKKLTEYFRGSAVLQVKTPYVNSFLRMLVSEKLPAKVYELTENGEKIGIEAVISPKFIKKIASSLDKYSIKVYIINIKGFRNSVCSNITISGIVHIIPYTSVIFILR